MLKKLAFSVFIILIVIVFGPFIFSHYETRKTGSNPLPPKIPYDLSTENLLRTIEAYTAAHEHDQSLIVSDMHFDLAIFYIHLGEEEKAREHLSKVKLSSRKTDLTQPYIAMILQAIARGDAAKVFSIMEDSFEIYNYAKNIRYEKSGEFGSSHDPSHESVARELCSYAVKAFAVAGDHDSLGKLAEMPLCGNLSWEISRHQLASLVAHKNYKGAYEFVVSRKEHKQEKFATEDYGWIFNPSYQVLDYCFSETLVPVSIPDSDQSFLLEEKEKQMETPQDNQAFFLSILLKQAGRYDDAYELAQKLTDPELRKKALLESYEAYYINGNREKTLETANAIDLPNAPPKDNPYGADRRSHQWYVEEVAEAEIWLAKPTALAYELAMKMLNDKTRFKALLSLYKASRKNGGMKFPGCEKDEFDCVEQELLTIAQKEDTFRDYMYSEIMELQKEAGKFQSAEETYRMIANPQGEICYYDVCDRIAEEPFADNPACDMKLPDRPDQMKYEELRPIVVCHYNSGVYRDHLTKPDKDKDSYFQIVAELLAKDEKYEEFFKVAAKIRDPIKRQRALLSAWWRVAPGGPVLMGFDESIAQEDREKREMFLTVLSKDSHFKNDYEIWNKFVDMTEFNYWNGFETRVYQMTAEEENAWREYIWDTADMILEQKPRVKFGFCSPRQFDRFSRQCEVQRLVAREKYQEALALLPDEEKALAARIILFERFMLENQLFRDSLNMHYPSTNIEECPVRL